MGTKAEPAPDGPRAKRVVRGLIRRTAWIGLGVGEVAGIVGALLLAVLLGYAWWTPGLAVGDGRHDLGRNGIWVQHGWLGDDEWFARNGKLAERRVPLGRTPGSPNDLEGFRNAKAIRALAQVLREHHITDVFPHLCPTGRDGRIAQTDAEQVERFLTEFGGFRVMPWVGGVVGKQAFPDDAAWREGFARSIAELLEAYPKFAGVHINIEPCPSGDAAFLRVLDDVRKILPPDKVLSVAAFPPPTLWHPFHRVHWDEAYFREVTRRADQVAVMMYDTALRQTKIYQHLTATWTEEVLNWTEKADVLLGLPAYEDTEAEYHFPKVENLHDALLGIHAGLSRRKTLPDRYQGVAIYSEWEMDEDEWRELDENFVRDSFDPTATAK